MNSLAITHGRHHNVFVMNEPIKKTLKLSGKMRVIDTSPQKPFENKADLCRALNKLIVGAQRVKDAINQGEGDPDPQSFENLNQLASYVAEISEML